MFSILERLDSALKLRFLLVKIFQLLGVREDRKNISASTLGYFKK
jgi:hypothetical protein